MVCLCIGINFKNKKGEENMNRYQSIELLNQAVGDELQSIHQYLNFHLYCERSGYEMLANIFDQIAIVEIKHLEMLADRISVLGGKINLRLPNNVEHCNTVKAMVAISTEMETLSAKHYRRRALTMMENSDFVSQKLFEELAVQEVEHGKVFYSKTRSLNELSAIAPNYAPSLFLRKQILEKEYCL